MKKILVALPVLAIMTIIQAQHSGNQLYDQSNRYVQNKAYNQGLDLTQEYYGKEYFDVDIEKNSDDEMIFEVNALKNVTADSYMAIFNMTQLGETAASADELMNNRFNGFKSELLTSGIAEDHIYLDMVSLIPIYEYEEEKKIFSKSYNEVPAGFEMQKNIHVSFTKATMLDKILTIAAQNEIYDLVKVEYFVNGQEKIYQELQKECIAFMQAKLEAFKSLNISFDTIYHIVSEKSAVAYPVDRYRSYQAYSGASIDALKKSSTVKKVRKPKTMFYNKLPYHKYDIVINPGILEPAVQFTYQLKVKFVVKAESKDKTYYIVSPDGTLKKLEIE